MASAKIIELTEENTCKICEGALAKYSCPRCNALYCSLTCYQSEKHSKCSEDFYKECVVNELADNATLDKNSKNDMLELLKRVHESNKLSEPPDGASDGELDSDDGEDFADLTERLAGIDLDEADEVWQRLTDDERQEFVAFLRSGDVSKLVPQWQPWWGYYDDSKVVEVDVETFKKDCPELAKTIKDFSELTSKPPAKCVEFNLTNVLAAYVFTIRYFNGEHRDFEKEAVSCACNLSLALKTNQNFEDFETAVKSVEQECVNIDWIITDTENISLMREDLMKILRGPNCLDKKYYVMCALSDLHSTLKSSLDRKHEKKWTPFSKQFENFPAPAVAYETKERVKLHMKKVDYLLSYAKDHLELS